MEATRAPIQEMETASRAAFSGKPFGTASVVIRAMPTPAL